MLDRIGELVRRLGQLTSDKRGGMAIMAAVSALALCFALGMGADYSFASYRRDVVNGFADAATLAGVTPAMMAQAPANAEAAAKAMFLSQVQNVDGVGASADQLQIKATDTNTGATVVRNVQLTYAFTSSNIFATLLGAPSINISGQSTATSQVAPRINWYLLLDDSPSMAIAATTTDIATMVAATPNQGGCAFACHETNPSNDGLGNPGGKNQDNYALARSLGVTLRIDLVNQATQSLMTYAQTTATTNHTVYQAAIYSMDINTNAILKTPSSLPSAQAAAGTLAALTVYDQSCVTKSNCNNDMDSYLDQGLSDLNAAMPNPGNGTSNPGDTPQEVLFVVTDGVTDYTLGGNRRMSPINTDYSWCSTIKARGIRIAFLYLTYYPLPTNSFYNSNIAPFQSKIPTVAQNCASTGLYFEVATNGDISSAMQTLFQRAVATAHLSQ